MRSLWGALARDPEQRETAYAMVSIVFEVAVLTAPALTALIVVAGLAGGRGAGRRRRSRRRRARVHRPPPASRRWRGEPHDVGWLGPLAAPGMRTVAVVAGARSGPRSGSCRCCCPRSPTSAGRRRPAALLLALLSAGSLARRARLRRALVAGRRRTAAGGADARARRRLRAARRAPARRPCSRVLLLACGLLLAPTHGRRLDAARHRRAGRHGDRGVRGDGDGDRGRHGGRATRSAARSSTARPTRRARWWRARSPRSARRWRARAAGPRWLRRA